MKLKLLCFYLFTSFTIFAQSGKENYKVWSSFLSESYPVDAYSKYQAIYIQDHTNNSNKLAKLSNTSVVKKVVSGLLSDSRGRTLNDSLWLDVFNKYDIIEKVPDNKLVDLFDKTLKAKLIGKRKIKRFSKLRGSYKTLITFSDCIFDETHLKCIFYCDSYQEKLSGSGHIVFMEKKKGIWSISYMLRMWVS